MRDNISYMQHFQPLNEEELKIIREAQRILGSSAAIPCTECHYCTEGCPKQIRIPEIFSAMNKQLADGQLETAKALYAQAVENGGKADACIGCRQCENCCPQHLPIIRHLQQAAEMFSSE